MIILPAIDLVGGEAVRLFRGDYAQKTVYSKDPLSVAKDFEASGARFIHLVDLEGAKSGDTPNFESVAEIVKNTSLSAEIGGGIRSMEVIEKYLSLGVDRVILGTAAVNDEAFVRLAAKEYGEHIVVGADIKDGFVAINGWTEKSALSCEEFCSKMCDIGIKTFIVTDISKDGAMQGTNHELYSELSCKFSINLIASGGVSSLNDVEKLQKSGIYGAIIGKAYYTGDIKLAEALKIARGETEL